MSAGASSAQPSPAGRLELVGWFALALLLVFVGNLVVEVRQVWGIAGDTFRYYEMIAAGLERGAPPFAFRPVIPLLAGLLPLAPVNALMVLTWACLCATFLISAIVLRRLGYSALATGLALLLLFSAPCVLYNYANPFLIDGGGLLVQALLLWALVAGRPTGFGLSVALGIAVREAAAFTAPAWLLARDRRRGAFFVALAVAAYVVVHLVTPHRADPNAMPLGAWLDERIQLRLDMGWRFVTRSLGAFGAIGPLAALGVLSLRGERARLIWPAALCLGAGVLLATVLAADIERMYVVLGPIAAVGLAQVVEALRRRRARATWLAPAIAVASVVFYPYGAIAPKALHEMRTATDGLELMLPGLLLALLLGTWLRTGLRIDPTDEARPRQA